MLLKCDFCGKEEEKQQVCIIASKNDNEWIGAIEGTGKTACPACAKKGAQEGQDRINGMIENHNKKAEGFFRENGKV